MSTYEEEQKRLAKLWNDFMSDEEKSEFGDVYLSDEFTPTVEDESVSSSSDEEEIPKKRSKYSILDHSQAGPSKSSSQNKPDTIEQSIEEVIRSFTAETTGDNDEAENTVNETIQWGTIDGSSLKHFNSTLGETGIKNNFYEEFISKEPYDFFKIFVTDDIIVYMVEQTNLYAEQSLKTAQKPKGHTKTWVPTTNAEMEKFLGILLWMGLMKLPTLRSYWSTNFLYTNKVNNIMPRNRFELLLKMWHFNDNEDESFGNDRLRKLTPLVGKLIDRFQAVVTPGLDVCIDETLVPFRGRLKFRQYIKNKRHKFGIKLYKLCTEGGYTYNLKIYCGSDKKEGSGSASANVVLSLMDDLLDSGRTLYTDNYYTSVSLATQLLQRNTHLVGTLRSNRKLNCKEVVCKKLKKNEIFGQESGTGIVMLKWKDKRDVTMLTTKHTADVTTVRQRGKDTTKPVAIVSYNKIKSFIDLSDQMKAYSHSLRRGTKWYRKLAIELIWVRH